MKIVKQSQPGGLLFYVAIALRQSPQVGSAIWRNMAAGDCNTAKAKAAYINVRNERRWSALRASDCSGADEDWKAAQDIAA